MPAFEDPSQDLGVLIEKAWDGSISPEDLARLDDCLVSRPELRRTYCETVHMSIGLMRLCDGAPLTGVQTCDDLYFESLWNALVREEKEAPVVVTEASPDTARLEHRQDGDRPVDARRVNKALLGLVAICSAAVMLVLTSAFLRDTLVPREVVTLDTSFKAGFSDNQAVAPGTRLLNRRGHFSLQTGLIEMAFDGGARVLIEAPAAFQLKSADRMVLYAGQLFARVPSEARGFVVETPRSRIKDMGTEFGVRVEQDGTSDVHMLRGKAALTSGTGMQSGRTLTLTTGQAKRVDTQGQIQDIPIQEQAFVRHVYSRTGFVWRGQRLSLADLVGHGNGLGSGQGDVYVDPVHGYTDSHYGSSQDNAYHVQEGNPFVDGLFIPNGSTRQVISSQGHVFPDCPGTNGECYANLGANPSQGVWATDMRTGIIRFDGQDYGDPDHPCLVMHANLGITFDLRAIRAICPDIEMTRFMSRIGIADFQERAGCNADFWVLVDGQVRVSRRHVAQKNSLTEVSIELRPSDRFLTLVTTDGGDIDRQGAYQRSYTCDWCVFVEPTLVVETGE